MMIVLLLGWLLTQKSQSRSFGIKGQGIQSVPNCQTHFGLCPLDCPLLAWSLKLSHGAVGGLAQNDVSNYTNSSHLWSFLPKNVPPRFDVSPAPPLCVPSALCREKQNHWWGLPSFQKPLYPLGGLCDSQSVMVLPWSCLFNIPSETRNKINWASGREKGKRKRKKRVATPPFCNLTTLVLDTRKNFNPLVTFQRLQ